MKHLLRVLCPILVLLIAATAFIVCDIMSAKDQVTVECETLYGDRSQAHGITLDMEATYRRHLYWNTRFSEGNEPKAETRYTFYDIQRDIDYNHPTDPLSMNDDVYYGIGEEDGWGLPKLYMDMLRQVPAGQESERTVRLLDYYQYYPLSVFVNIPSNYLGWSSNIVYSGDDSLMSRYGDYITAFNDFFRIPVLPTEYFTIAVRRNAAESTYASYDRSGEDIFTMETQSVQSEDAFYFAFDAHTQSKNPYSEEYSDRTVDTSCIKGGFGIYKLPYMMGEKRLNDIDIQVDGLKTVFPLDPHSYIVELKLSEDGSLLYLFTIENDILHVTVIDTETYTMQQKVRLGSAKNRYGIDYYVYEDFMVIYSDYEQLLYVLSRDEHGLLTFDFAAEMNRHDENITHEQKTFGYDGERLVMCTPHSGRGDTYIKMLVYTKRGLVYHGQYTLSLSSGEWNMYNIVFSDSNFATVSFE